MQEDVKTDVVESTTEEVKEVSQETTETKEEVKPGDKTEPNLLLKSLQEERERRRVLEEELKTLKKQEVQSAFSDEGLLLESKIKTLEKKLELKDILEKYPVLKDKIEDFDDYATLYPEAKLQTVAKMFIADRDLIEKAPEKKGLERTTGGGKQNPQIGMTPDDIEKLRVTNFRQYMRLLKEGKLK